MICRICHKEYQPQHFNQKLCSVECKKESVRITKQKYKKTEKGRLSETRWRKNPKKKEIDNKYHKSEKGLVKARIRSKQFRERNPEYVRKQAEIERNRKRWLTEDYRLKNKINSKKYRQTEKGKIANKNGKARRRSYLENAGSFTLKEWLDKVKEFDNKCAICKKVVKLTVDHIKPVSKGGMNTIDNIQPLCKSCNSKKSNKYE